MRVHVLIMLRIFSLHCESGFNRSAFRKGGRIKWVRREQEILSNFDHVTAAVLVLLPFCVLIVFPLVYF